MGQDLPFDLDAALTRYLAASQPAPAAEEPPVAPRAWLQELLRESARGGPLGHGDEDAPLEAERPPSAPPGWVPPPLSRRSLRGRAVPLTAGEALLRKRVRRLGDPPAALRGLRPGALPPDAAAHMAIAEYVYAPALEALEASILEEPIFAYSARRWRSGYDHARWHQDRRLVRDNLEVLYRLYDRLSILMGAYFEFDPAPMAYVPEMTKGALGIYFPDSHVMGIASHMLGASLDEVVDTIAHEQIHALQFRSMDGRRGLDPWEQSLVRYWKAEEPRRMANPMATNVGIEALAYYVGSAVGSAFTCHL